MSTTRELNVTTLTTSTMTTATTTLAASSTKLDVEAEDDEEPPTTFEALDMDLVNGPNPWLPAYGFQLQHRSHFQPVHEDLRTNGSYCYYFTFYHCLNNGLWHGVFSRYNLTCLWPLETVTALENTHHSLIFYEVIYEWRCSMNSICRNFSSKFIYILLVETCTSSEVRGDRAWKKALRLDINHTWISQFYVSLALIHLNGSWVTEPRNVFLSFYHKLKIIMINSLSELRANKNCLPFPSVFTRCFS